jgi:4-hydroxy-3-methylbut-2-en-1-yl diphosphate synthase IspG/GcpE
VLAVGSWDERIEKTVRAALRTLGQKPEPLVVRWQIDVVHGIDLADCARRLAEATAEANLELVGFDVRGAGMGQALKELSSLHWSAGSKATRPLLAARIPHLLIPMAVELSGALLDGYVDLLTAEAELITEVYALLQATRRRLTRTEFISCPGCGRLDFELEPAVTRIKSRFGHLQDVRIAIMGCAVNGPGEMADADFGYVGAARGKVDLYIGSKRTARGLSPEKAEQELEDILRERGLWQDP